jgi:hypothetical protein
MSRRCDEMARLLIQGSNACCRELPKDPNGGILLMAVARGGAGRGTEVALKPVDGAEASRAEEWGRPNVTP